MDLQPDPRRLTARQQGFATLQNVVAAGIAMVFFAVLANLVVMQYSIGVMSAAAADGVRQGSRSTDPIPMCAAAAHETLAAVAAGALTAASVGCRTDGDWLVARVSGNLVAWAPLLPVFAVEREARAAIDEPES